MNTIFLISIIIQFATQTISLGFGRKDFSINRARKNIQIVLHGEESAFSIPGYYPIPVILKKYTFQFPIDSLHIIKYHYSKVVKNIELTTVNPVPLIIKKPLNYKYGGKGIKIKFPAYIADKRFNRDGSTTVTVAIFPLKYEKDQQSLYVLDSLSFYFTAGTPKTYLPEYSKDLPSLYLIIARDSILSGFSKLALWKKQKGYKVKMLSMEDIEANFSGRDSAEKLRNALKLYYSDSNLVYVLLGGDVDAVPARVAYAMTCEAHFADDEDSIRADLYYSDLDGTWDYNNNGVFGEVADSVDLYPDVYVGRVPADNVEEAMNFSEKLIRYEQNPGSEVSKALFFAMVLWEDPFTNSGESKDFIDTAFIPEYYSITKLYEANGNETYSSVMSALRQGNGILNHNGHGWWTGMWLNGSPNWEHLDTLDADTIHMTFSGVLYSIGCWVGAFDREDAIVEHFILNPYGPVAFIANSRYGWGSPGNPLYGYSDKLDQNFYRKIFVDSIYHVGMVLAEDKADFVPLSRWENVYRWHQYEVNLFGDPEMEIHTDNRGVVLTDFPDTISEGSNISFTVYDSHGTRLKNAKVALSYIDSVYITTTTEDNGIATITIPEIPFDSIYLTIYARNHITLKKWLHVSHGLAIERIEFRGADNTDYPFPGDSGSINLYLRNKSNTALNLFPVKLIATNISLLEDSLFVEDTIYPDSIYTVNIPFKIDSSVLENDTISILVKADDFRRSFVIPLKKPHLSISIDIDSTIESPWDTISFVLTNKFFSSLYNITLHIFCVSGDVIVLRDSIFIPEIQSLSSQRIQVPIEIQDTGIFELGIRAFNNTYLDDTFFIFFSNQNINYIFDFESSLNEFYYTGSWQRTTRRAYSGSYSIWDGIENHYTNNANDTIITPWVRTGYAPKLSFYMWYNAAIYGQDGIHVFYLNKEGTWSELDYIGSGGALGDKTKGFTTGWANYTYPLNGLSYGDSTRIMFVLTTDDSDTAEGFYIDRVMITSSNYLGVRSLPEYGTGISLPTLVSHFLPVSFSLDAPPELYILDVQGREVFKIKARENLGKIVINTNELKPGLYFVNIKTPKLNYVKKVVIQR